MSRIFTAGLLGFATAMRSEAARTEPATQNLGAGLSSPMQIVLLLTLLTLLPALIMCLTPFLRLSIVLHFLRQALGTQTVPSNQVLLGLSLLLSLIIMQPVLTNIYSTGWQPFEEGRIGWQQAVDATSLVKFKSTLSGPPIWLAPPFNDLKPFAATAGTSLEPRQVMPGPNHHVRISSRPCNQRSYGGIDCRASSWISVVRASRS